jgi:Cof subfamily protein (haloacid dehalogenase superfamily)
MMRTRLLLAIDMDGTLLRDDKTIAEEDVAAIRAASSHGIAVTIATGRLTTGALPTARELGLSTPLVCADGGVLIDPLSGATLHQLRIVSERATSAVEALLGHGLVPYVFLAGAIHCEPSGERYRAVVDTWSRDLIVHPSLLHAGDWKRAEGVSMTVGIGAQSAVEQASEHLRAKHADALDTVHFSMTGMAAWAVRSLPPGCDKGEMLARLALRMDIPQSRVVAVGDWFNDIGMFKYAGRSFAMGHAPDLVREAASDVLRSTSARGGGIAEVIATLISELPST